MLISLQDIITRYKIFPQGVIHVGAHYGQEAHDYRRMMIYNMVFIEPCAEAFKILTERLKNWPAPEPVLINCACGATCRHATMNVSHDAEGQSNSLLKPKLHLQQHPEVRFTDTEDILLMTLDDVMSHAVQLSPLAGKTFDFLNMDVQGYELEVLKGATETLKNIRMVYSEVNNGETYEGNARIEELDAFLKPYDLRRVETYWPSANWTWGDAVWIKL